MPQGSARAAGARRRIDDAARLDASTPRTNSVVVLDAQGTVQAPQSGRRGNRSVVARGVSFTVGEHLATGAGSVVDPDERDRLRAVLERVADAPTGTQVHVTLNLRTEDGVSRRFAVRFTNQLGVSGSDGIVGQLSEMSDREPAEVRLEALLAQSSDVTVVLSGAGRIEYVSPSVTGWTGWHPDDLVGLFGTDLAHPDDCRVMRDALLALRPESGSVAITFRFQSATGDWHVFDSRMTDARNLPAVGGIIMNARDVTQLVSTEVRTRALAQYSTDAVMVFADEGPCVYASPACAEVLGMTPEDLIGRDRLVELLFPDDRPMFAAAIHELHRRGEGATETMELRVRDGRTADGWRWVESRITNMLSSAHVGGWVFNTRDINERRRALAMLEHQATHDELTGLPNRRLLEARLDGWLKAGTPVTLLFCDVDRFKLVNDSHGHGVGDTVLRAVAGRLGDAVPEALVTRFAGDEFVVATNGDGAGLAERVMAAFVAPLRQPSRPQLHLRVSVGSAASEPGMTAAELLRRADVALYAAKADGRDRHVAYTVEVADRTAARYSLEQDLRRAMSAKHLEAWYQPIVRLATGEVVGLEALVRWRHPGRGLILPEVFIPLAEEVGLISSIDLAVLELALTQARRWDDAGIELPISVNLSAQDLRAELPALLGARLVAAGVQPGRLTIEVTETAAVETTEAIDALLGVARLGVGIAIDDFGTGWSTLAQLRRIPATMLKVDGTFVRDLVHDRGARAIVAASVAMAHEFGVAAVAEHVETAAQRDALIALGVELGQGSFYGRAAPAGDLGLLAPLAPA